MLACPMMQLPACPQQRGGVRCESTASAWLHLANSCCCVLQGAASLPTATLSAGVVKAACKQLRLTSLVPAAPVPLPNCASQAPAWSPSLLASLLLS